MTLNRQSNILACLAVIAVLVVALVNRASIGYIQSATQQITMAENTVKGVANFRFLVMETALYNELRSTQQWQSHIVSFDKMLAGQRYRGADKNRLLEKEKNNLKVLADLYQRLIGVSAVPSANSPAEEPLSKELIASTVSQLFLTTQDMQDDAFELVQLNRADLANAQNQSAIFMQLSIALLAALIVAGYVIIKRQVLIPVAALQGGAERVRQGDLTFRLNLPVANEIGLLANTFDHMTQELAQAQAATQSTLKKLGNKTVELISIQRQLQTIIDQVPALIGSWDAECCNLFGNRAYRDWFGISPEDMRGKHMRDIVGEGRFNQLEPYLQSVLAGNTEVFEKIIYYPNGDSRHAIFSYVPDIEDGHIKGFYGFISDITPLKQAEVAKESVLIQLQNIVDAAKDFAIIECNADGVIGLFNSGAENLLGYKAREVVDIFRLDDFHAPGEILQRSAELSSEYGFPIEGFDVIVELPRRGESESREWTYLHKDGSGIAVNLTVTAIRNDIGRITGYLGIAKDIRQDKRIIQTLAETRDRAEAANLSKSQFLANMSHEIRTPLNAVLGITYLLARTSLTSDQKKYLEMISSSGKSLLAILNDILDFSKIEAGRMELSPTQFKLNDVLQSLATIMSINAGDKNIELAIAAELDVPQVLIGDALRLQQILVNLVGNAIKFTEQGEVSVLVECVARQTGAVTLCFKVRDTGIGMTQAQQDRLFSPFTQADSSTTRRFGGTGLGLTISRRLVELMRGTLELRSAVDQGSEFSITLPLLLGKDETEQRNPHELGLLKLLVADNNQTSRDYLEKIIRSWGWQVDTVTSGEEALTQIRAHYANGKSYDVVMVDWHLPGMDGMTTMTEIKQHLSSDTMPLLILLSTFARGKLLHDDASVDTRPDAYLFKPITSSNLFDTLQDAIKQRTCGVVAPVEPPKRSLIARPNARLLLVEDNPFNQIVAKNLLAQAGAIVDVVDDGCKAVAAIRENPRVYDLILMDVQMPVMDGFTATRIIREELGLTLPILAMTAGVTEFEREQCITSGMNDLIAKPIDIEHMLLIIDRHLPALTIAAPTLATDISTTENVSQDYFNGDALIALMANNAEQTKKMLQLIRNLIDSSSISLSKLHEAFAEARFADMAKLLHSMRGSIGTLGAKRFVSASHDLEQVLASDDRSAVAELLARVDTELAATVAAAQQWLQTR